MHYVVAVHVMQTSEYHAHNSTEIFLSKQTLLFEGRVGIHLLNLLINDLLKLSGFLKILHHDEKILFVFIRFDILHDIGVIKHGQDSDFLAHYRHDFRVHVLLKHDLHGIFLFYVKARLEQKDVSESTVA